MPSCIRGTCSAYGVMNSCRILVGNPSGVLKLYINKYKYIFVYVCVCHMNLYHEAVGCEGLDSVHAAQNCVRWQAIFKNCNYRDVTPKAGIIY